MGDMIDMKDVQFRFLDISMADLRIDFDRFAGVAPLFNEITDTVLDLMVPSAVQVLRGLIENIGTDFINDKISKLPDIGFLCERETWRMDPENINFFDAEGMATMEDTYNYLTLQEQTEMFLDIFLAENEYEVERILALPPYVQPS